MKSSSREEEGEMVKCNRILVYSTNGWCCGCACSVEPVS